MWPPIGGSLLYGRTHRASHFDRRPRYAAALNSPDLGGGMVRMRRSSMKSYWWQALLVLFALLLFGCDRKEPREAAAKKTAVQLAKAPEAQKLIELSFVYGSEKKAWLSRAIQTFNEGESSKVEAGRIKVVGTAAGSGSAVQDIIAGSLKPDVFSPASGVFITELNRQWLNKTGAVGGAKSIAPEGKNLVLSPVVIAMWKPMAEALGWPEKQLGWQDILQLSKNPKGWAAHDHAEWGTFKLGHTHPEFSNSGLLSILAEIYAGSSVQRGLNPKMLEAPKVGRYLADIEQSIVHYGKSTGFFATKMLERGPAFLSAAVLYENLVVDSYRQEQFKDRTFDLVCIYPKEGTFWIDNPYVVLEAPWATPEKKLAAEAFGKFLRSKQQQLVAMKDFGFRPSDPTIAISAPLDAAHGVDPLQPKALLEVPEPDVIDAALALWRKNKKTVDIAFVFDRSGSMHGLPLNQAKQGAMDFLDQLDDRDRVSLLLFNDQVPESLVAPEALATGREKLKQTLMGVFANGGTAMFDAVVMAHRELGKIAEKDPKRLSAIVLLSDGRDEHSKATLSDLKSAIGAPVEMSRPPIRVFTIAYGSGADPAMLSGIAETGAGAFFKGDTASIRQVYRDLAAFF